MIKVTTKYGPSWINPRYIVRINPGPQGKGATIIMNGEALSVIESAEGLNELIYMDTTK